MNCTKCGVELKNSGVFCEDCLADMEKYPVNPNVTVRIPYRPTPAPVKKAKKSKAVKPEEQIRHLKNVRNWLLALLIVSLVALAASVIMMIHLVSGNEGIPDLEQNYGITGSADST